MSREVSENDLVCKYKNKFLSVNHSKSKYRSSSPEVFCKKGVIRNFPKFTGKNLCQSLFFNRDVGLKPVNT